MLDFLLISTRSNKKGIVEIYPKFIIKKSSDLMIRGSDFYAIWVENKGLWSTDEQEAIQLIDSELDLYFQNNKSHFDSNVKVLHLWDAETGMIDNWHKYCQKQMPDSFSMLDEKLIFSNSEIKKSDYASKKLNYPLEPGTHDAFDKLMNTLYSEDERRKIEWAIGSVISGESKRIQKFLVLYGAAGTGKSTVLNIIQLLFDGYYSVFDAKALGSSSNSFALEAFKSNPLVAIQHDGDLSRIEDNTRLNSLVSHEMMTVNEKFKSTYSNRFKSFLFMGTNKPVKITDGRSGLLRRLIDVTPTGNKIPIKEYKQLTKQIEFELGAIACYCLDIFNEDPGYYDDYVPTSMMGASNDFYNFMEEYYYIFETDDSVSLKSAWEMYKSYCENAKIAYPFNQRVFKEELKNYFEDYKDRETLSDGTRVRSYYIGFKKSKFVQTDISKKPIKEKLIELKECASVFDRDCAGYLAQYATASGTPSMKWDSVNTTLSDLDTSKLHYVRVPENHIVIDFDISGDDGNKSLEKNLKEASKWPPTYAELSKSGAGVHLHYIYSGDVSKLSRIYDDHIEIKIFTGNSSLRRKLTKCNSLPIVTINSGLPLKEDGKMVNFESFKSEKGLRTVIKKNLNKEIHPGTKPSIDFIYKILEDAYNSGLKYDVTDLSHDILSFAAQSTHHSEYCVKLVGKMRFKSEDPSLSIKSKDDKITFYDIEVFPNLFLVNWKFEGKGKPVIRMINPNTSDIEDLMTHKLVGFNCRRYDNHLLYAAMMGCSNEELYSRSQRIINKGPNAFLNEAYNVSYTDVYDYAAKKQGLKKWEIELGINHKELGLPWDEPVDESLWPKVAEYCDNDVLATEAVWNATKADFTARKILADVAGMTVNDTTNTLTTRIIFGTNRKPQDQFNYRDLGDTSDISTVTITEDNVLYNNFGDEYTVFNSKCQPVFPGYSFERGVSTYRGEKIGEGGYVYSEPGIYTNVALLDIASMHPSSIIAEELFGPEYTLRFKELRDARIAIKHKDFSKAKKMLGGVLAKYLDDEDQAKNLAQALKIAINSVYGLTSAKFDNPFNDIRNKDNIVAKRGALFMVNLKHVVQERGFTVAHIKTDSIKIPNATPEIIKFVIDYGKQYGYSFEHEATYEKMCLVNDAVYICYHDNKWEAVGTQFQVPYVFKTLFSKEPLIFDDFTVTKSVQTKIFLDMNEKLSENEHDYRFVGGIGQFTPIISGKGGGLLVCERENKQTGEKKYDSVVGAKGYRWLESETVKSLQMEECVDKSYFRKMADEAIETIKKFGDYELFVSDAPYNDKPPWE